jgi:hypothetical protein
MRLAAETLARWLTRRLERALRATNAFHSSMPRDCLAASFIYSTLRVSRPPPQHTMAIALKLRTAQANCLLPRALSFIEPLGAAAAMLHGDDGAIDWRRPANC